MKTEVEELLTDELRYRAGQAALPPALLPEALVAGARRRRRQRRARLAGVAGTAALAGAGGLVVALLAAAPRAQTVAYVVGRTQSALAAVGGDVLEVSSRAAGGWSLEGWFAQADRPVRLDVHPPSGGPTEFYAGYDRTVVVSYRTRQWWELERLPASRDMSVTQGFPAPARRVGLLPPTVIRVMNAWGGPRTSLPTAANIRKELANGSFRLVGRETVHGQPLLELRGHDSLMGLGAPAGADYHTLVLWISARTYLPVWSVAGAGQGGGPALYSTFTWLKPTAANLAVFTPKIPAGFRRAAGS
jgi:hypothetical protein